MVGIPPLIPFEPRAPLMAEPSGISVIKSLSSGNANSGAWLTRDEFQKLGARVYAELPVDVIVDRGKRGTMAQSSPRRTADVAASGDDCNGAGYYGGL